MTTDTEHAYNAAGNVLALVTASHNHDDQLIAELIAGMTPTEMARTLGVAIVSLAGAYEVDAIEMGLDPVDYIRQLGIAIANRTTKGAA